MVKILCSACLYGRVEEILNWLDTDNSYLRWRICENCIKNTLCHRCRIK